MAQLRRSMTTNLGSETDKDIIDFANACHEKGVNDSMIIKNCIRYWIKNFGNTPPVPVIEPANKNKINDINIKQYIKDIVKEVVKETSKIEKKTKPTTRRKSTSKNKSDIVTDTIEKYTSIKDNSDGKV